MKPGRLKLGRIGKSALILALMISATWAVCRNARVLNGYGCHINLALLLAALPICIGYRLLNSCGWQLILRSVGSSVPLLDSVRIWLTSEAMRWLPGSIWNFGSRIVQAKNAGVNLAAASVSVPLELSVTVAAWSIVALVGGVHGGFTLHWHEVALPNALLIGAVGGAILLVAVAVFAGTGVKKVQSFPAGLSGIRQVRIRLGPLCLALAYYTILCAVNGLAFYTVLRSVATVPLDLRTTIGVNAFGWIAGLLAIGLPAGIGARDACSALLLVAAIPREEAAVGVLLWRLILIADELFCILIAMALSKLAQREASLSAAPLNLANPYCE
jgi:hypothetical protein